MMTNNKFFFEKKASFVFLLLFLTTLFVNGQNPIIPNMGANDPHIHIFNDTAYLYASHDKSADSKSFIMEDWWIWSSPDLVNWTYRSTLKPEDTYIGKPFTGCWATDVGKRNGKYYWYYSEKNEQTGVAVGPTPVGPWKDPLGKPLLTSDLTPTIEYDMAIFEEKGNHYIIFGVWDYYIAKLNDDMISLAEQPKKIEIKKPRGPYNQDGLNAEKPTDDKPFVHFYNGKYYLSWGVFYAMADNLYGPYDYKGTIMDRTSFAPGYDAPTWPNGFLQGRHGSFFEWHGQWYFSYCDISQTGNRYFRDTFLSYIHYRKDGTMALIRVDGTGVGRYLPKLGPIEAEDYFRAKGNKKVENANGGFVVESKGNVSSLTFPNMENTKDFTKMKINLSASKAGNYTIEVRRDGVKGKLLGLKNASLKAYTNPDQEVLISLSKLNSKENICIITKTTKGMSLRIDKFEML